MPLEAVALVVGCRQRPDPVVGFGILDARVSPQGLDRQQRLPAGPQLWVGNLLAFGDTRAAAGQPAQIGYRPAPQSHQAGAPGATAALGHTQAAGHARAVGNGVAVGVSAVFHDGLPGHDVEMLPAVIGARILVAYGKDVVGGAIIGIGVDDVGAIARDDQGLDLAGFDGEIHDVTAGVVQVEVGIRLLVIGDQHGDALAGQQFHPEIVLDVAAGVGAPLGAGLRLVHVAAQGYGVGHRLRLVRAVVAATVAGGVIVIPVHGLAGRCRYRAADTEQLRLRWRWLGWCHRRGVLTTAAATAAPATGRGKEGNGRNGQQLAGGLVHGRAGSVVR